MSCACAAESKSIEPAVVARKYSSTCSGVNRWLSFRDERRNCVRPASARRFTVASPTPRICPSCRTENDPSPAAFGAASDLPDERCLSSVTSSTTPAMRTTSPRPSDGPVRPMDAKLERRPAAFDQGAGDPLLHGGAVAGMHLLQEQLVRCLQRAGLVSEDLVRARRPRHAPGVDVPTPGADLRSVDRCAKRVLLLWASGRIGNAFRVLTGFFFALHV